jgi:hypothetical protein
VRQFPATAVTSLLEIWCKYFMGARDAQLA